MSTAVEETALVPAGVTDIGSPLPVFRGQEMAQALVAYKELQRALDASMPDQLMNLGDKQFRKKGYWRAVEVAFNLSVEMQEERREVYGDLEDGTPNYTYLVTYRAKAPNGRTVTGDGACTAAEKSKGRMLATEHNVRSHAHTRAFNRAVSNLVGFGEVSAEEVERSEHGTIDVEVVGGPSHHAPARQPMQAPERKSAPISEAQCKRMFAIAKGAGWSIDGYREHLKSHGIADDRQTPRHIYEQLCSEFESGNQ